LALGPGSAVPCAAIRVLLHVEIIDQSITPVKLRMEYCEQHARGRGCHGIEGRTSPRHSCCEAHRSTGACRRAVRLQVSAWSKGLGTSSAGAALGLHCGARRGRDEALGGAGCQRRGVETTELLVVQERGDGRMRPTEWAGGITPDADLAEPHRQGIVHQQAPHQRLPFADQ